MLKAVIDTNTLINGSADDYNYGNRIIDAVIRGEVKAYANPGTVRENRLIAERKISDQDYLKKLSLFFDSLENVEPDYSVNLVEDADDNKILASAVAAEADYLITSDWHLLKIGQYQKVKVITPQGFWGEFESQTNRGWHNWLKDFIN